MTTPIPQPPPLPLVGNLRDIDPHKPIDSLARLAEQYGPIFKLSFFGVNRYFVTSPDLLNELCDEKRFCKSVQGALEQIRNGVGDGLFTAHYGEHNWEVAHRTLVPAFGPIGIHEMYDAMYDLATQLVAKWARGGPEQKINVTDDFTRLTLDSIALCAMGKRFNSFYSEEMHPFVGAMVRFLVESGMRPRRTWIESFIWREPERQYWQDIEYMKGVCKELINHRRANPVEKKDLLNAMLFGRDPKTKERLTDESVVNNMITFLIAGHETTSGLLSFITYYLIKNPEALTKAQKEVDTVVGQGPVTADHITKLPYLEAVMRETLRLCPTAPGFSVTPLPNKGPQVIGGGKYLIPEGGTVFSNLPTVGRNKEAFGEDADEFRPERMYGENFSKLPPNAWKPFGNGARGCIGRSFAWQEALLALALILQNFDLKFDDPSYQLHIKSTLTIKPGDFYIRASLREGIETLNIERKLYEGVHASQSQRHSPSANTEKLASGKPLLILYGSNSGTCEGLAQKLGQGAGNRGYNATIKPLDEAVDAFPTNIPVVIITASYEGNPPDNADSFVGWLKSVDPEKIKGAQFAVFGCGHHDWVATYQKVPKLVESELLARGARSITGWGESDVALGKVFDDFDAWQDDQLWPVLAADSDVSESNEALDMEISTNSRASHLRHNVQNAEVLHNETLTQPGTGEKRVTEFKLPAGMSYDAGDYLALLPVSRIETISRVLRRFGLPWDATMTLRKGAHTTIPTEIPVSVTTVLGAYVELNSPASRKNLATLKKYSKGETVDDDLLAQKYAPSVMELLEEYPGIELPFPVFLSMLPPMRIRQYSISSSALLDPSKARIVYSVVDADPKHLGVATNYLKSLQPGSTVQVMIKKSHASFHPPADPNVPIIMLCAGSGIAPFLGFVEERAARIAASALPASAFGAAVLFVGCRDPVKDRVYAAQLDRWQRDGVVKVYYAFSRDPSQSHDCRYAQDRLWRERDEVSRLFDAGARAYICGSSALGKGIADVVARMVVEQAERKGKEVTVEQGLKWWEGLRGERYAVDVFD